VLPLTVAKGKSSKGKGKESETAEALEKAAPPSSKPSSNGDSFDPRKSIHVSVTPETLKKVAERAQREYIYEHSLGRLQIELVKLQETVKAKGLKVAVLFEGRDAAGALLAGFCSCRCPDIQRWSQGKAESSAASRVQ